MSSAKLAILKTLQAAKFCAQLRGTTTAGHADCSFSTCHDLSQCILPFAATHSVPSMIGSIKVRPSPPSYGEP